MADKEKNKKAAADDKANPTHVVANRIINDLARIHMRIPKF
jgi:hypothetical protein